MPPTKGDSTVAQQSAVTGTNTSTPVTGIVGPSVGVEGRSDAGWAVYGHSTTGRGVVASSETNYGIRATSRTLSGIRSSSVDGRGIEGESTNSDGVVGTTTGAGAGVIGVSNTGFGVLGQSTSGRGVVARSDTDYGLRATSRTLSGIRASSVSGRGIEGESTSSDAILGNADGPGTGVIGLSRTGIGILGRGGRLAARFEGNVEVTGDINLTNGDCAEEFDTLDGQLVAAGTVMVLDDDGTVSASSQPYDRRVAGVVSGAGTYRPAIVLDRRPRDQESSGARQPLALMGKVYCQVDADAGAIAVGDLLTTSSTPGHAMRAAEPARAFGAVIGKALRPFAAGRGLIPILVALQ